MNFILMTAKSYKFPQVMILCQTRRLDWRRTGIATDLPTGAIIQAFERLKLYWTYSILWNIWMCSMVWTQVFFIWSQWLRSSVVVLVLFRFYRLIFNVQIFPLTKINKFTAQEWCSQKQLPINCIHGFDYKVYKN